MEHIKYSLQCFLITNHLSCLSIGNTVPAVFAIPAASRPGFTGYFFPTPPTAYRNPTWMPYAGENELPGQWADSVIEQISLSMIYIWNNSELTQVRYLEGGISMQMVCLLCEVM